MVIYRTKIGNIISEFSLAVGRPKGVIIICDGLPGKAGNKDLMAKINSFGFLAFYPRYSGTWESRGKFLSPAPTHDIISVLNKIKAFEITELYSGKKFDFRDLPISLLGGSFGGTVALSLVAQKSISKIIAFSPIVDFKSHNSEGNEQDLIWLMKFMQKAFGRAYDFSKANWKQMLKGEIFNPPKDIEWKRAADILIFYDKKDAAIDWMKVAAYAEKNLIKAVVTNGIGHISFSKITNKQWGIVKKWLEKKVTA